MTEWPKEYNYPEEYVQSIGKLVSKNGKNYNEYKMYKFSHFIYTECVEPEKIDFEKMKLPDIRRES